MPTQVTDVVVIGAGIIGAACADQLSAAGLSVTVLDRGAIASGTTGAGEGNVLVSDKEPGPELALALLSRELWARFGDELPEAAAEPKGGVVVALTEPERAALDVFAARQRAAGVRTETLSPEQARVAEPHLTPELAGAVRYSQDMQAQPARAAAALLHRARSRGATLRTHCPVTGFTRDTTGRITAVHTPRETIGVSTVVNAAGLGSAEIAGLAGLGSAADLDKAMALRLLLGQRSTNFMPGTAWPVNGYPPGLSRNTHIRPGSDVV